MECARYSDCGCRAAPTPQGSEIEPMAGFQAKSSEKVFADLLGKMDARPSVPEGGNVSFFSRLGLPFDNKEETRVAGQI